MAGPGAPGANEAAYVNQGVVSATLAGAKWPRPTIERAAAFAGTSGRRRFPGARRPRPSNSDCCRYGNPRHKKQKIMRIAKSGPRDHNYPAICSPSGHLPHLTGSIKCSYGVPAHIT
jgi:hypothetical protein